MAKKKPPYTIDLRNPPDLSKATDPELLQAWDWAYKHSNVKPPATRDAWLTILQPMRWYPIRHPEFGYVPGHDPGWQQVASELLERKPEAVPKPERSEPVRLSLDELLGRVNEFESPNLKDEFRALWFNFAMSHLRFIWEQMDLLQRDEPREDVPEFPIITIDTPNVLDVMQNALRRVRRWCRARQEAELAEYSTERPERHWQYIWARLADPTAKQVHATPGGTWRRWKRENKFRFKIGSVGIRIHLADLQPLGYKDDMKVTPEELKLARFDE